MISDVRTYLTARFIIAIALIFAVMTFSFFLISSVIKSSVHDGYVINASGAQRMNSQRIALMAREISGAKSAEEADGYIVKMRVNFDRMSKNHKELSTGEFDDGVTRELKPQIKEMYFKPGGIDEEVTHYLSLASEFLDLYEEQGFEIAKNSPLIDEIVEIARNGFLDKLDVAVFEHEKVAQGRIDTFEMYQRISYGIGIFLLFLVFSFILRPVARRLGVVTSDLANRNDELIEFSYRISHDLRSPIKSVKGLMGIASAAAQTDDKDGVEEVLGHATKSLNKLENLTEDIIMLTKMKMSEVPDVEFNPRELIEASLESVQNIEGAKDITFSTSYGLTSELVSMKKLYLSQSLDNLLSNAIKYRDTTKDNSKVDISVTQSSQEIKIDISDNGIGIPPDRADNLFKMFQRFHPKQSYGSGLGLYLVAQNIAALGGQITYKALEDGSSFQIHIPLPSTHQKAA